MSQLSLAPYFQHKHVVIGHSLTTGNKKQQCP